MSFLKLKFKDKRALITTFAISMFLFGIVFGCIYYYYGTEPMITFFSKLFFSKKEGVTNDYNFYIITTSLYILIALLLSTSFLGTLFNSFIVFSKGMHIAIATLFLFNKVQISVGDVFVCYIPQLIIEVVLIYVISIITLKLSINSFMISFTVNDTFNTKRIINYVLDYLIIILIILSVSMLFRVYLI